MSGVLVSSAFWRDRRVFVTGHTGFKGGWLALWLKNAGAVVHGFSLDPPFNPSLFEVAKVRRALASHTIGDIRNFDHLAQAMLAADPQVVFHLAAQPLVRTSYQEPIETYATNVMGTVHLLEAVRRCKNVRAVVNVTTDKCYSNNEWLWPYRETDPIGGHDPYASSKGCAELVTSAYRCSFLAGAGVAVASARAGNVIGGGDWASDRLIPDFFRAAVAKTPIEVRHPDATRPWQHVLEPVSGYMLLAERLAQHGQTDAEAWNFGPRDEDARPVSWLLNRLVSLVPGTDWHHVQNDSVHEAMLLKLDSSKARHRLKWAPQWELAEALQRTVDWHVAWQAGQDMHAYTFAQIAFHQKSRPEQVL